MFRLLDPKNDWMFKQLFGTEKRKELTIHLINSLMESCQPKVADVTFLKPVLDKEVATLRESIVDVHCKAVDGREFIVEMQRASDTYFIPRVVEYTCQVYVNQRPKFMKEVNDRGGYDKMHPVVCLAIMENTVFPDKKAYLSHHSIRDVDTNMQDIKELSFTFLELSKFHKKFEELNTDEDKWAYFLKRAPTVPPEQFEKILREDSIFSVAYNALVNAAYTEAQLQEYLRYDQKQAEIRIQKAEERALGRAEGLVEGRAEGLAEGERRKAENVARKALCRGMTVLDVADLTGLSVEDVMVLKDSRKI